MQRLLHPGPFARRDQHDILAALSRDHHGSAVGDDLVEHRLQVLARFGIGHGLQRAKMRDILPDVENAGRRDGCPRATPSPQKVQQHAQTLSYTPPA